MQDRGQAAKISTLRVENLEHDRMNQTLHKRRTLDRQGRKISEGPKIITSSELGNIKWMSGMQLKRTMMALNTLTGREKIWLRFGIEQRRSSGANCSLAIFTSFNQFTLFHPTDQSFCGVLCLWGCTFSLCFVSYSHSMKQASKHEWDDLSVSP